MKTVYYVLIGSRREYFLSLDAALAYQKRMNEQGFKAVLMSEDYTKEKGKYATK